jgi:TolB-like protein/Tfp pilus assembly protein PilF
VPSFVERLRERKLVQWALAYLAGAFVVLQVLDAVSESLSLTQTTQRVVLALIGIGFFLSLVLAWYHGEKGRQRASGPELLMVAALLVVAGAVVSYLTRAPSPAAEVAATASMGDDGRPRVAVLPCEDVSPDSQDAYRASGLHDEILLKLQKISSLVSIGRTSVLRYAETYPATAEVAAELGVEFVGECTVQRSDDRIRVIFQLLEPDGAQVWAEDYNRDLTLDNILDIQIAVAEQIASAVGAVVTDEEEGRIQSIPTANLTAYDLYLLGRTRWWLRTPAALEEALELYQAAIEEDPTFALAYAGLAQTYQLLPQYAFESEVDVHDVSRRAKEAARTALELDSDLAEAYTALGYVAALYEWAWEEAERAFTRALQLEPGNAQALSWYSELLMSLGRTEQAVQVASRAAEIEPRYYSTRIDLAYALWHSGDLAAAEQELRTQMVVLPGHPAPYFVLAAIYREVGRWEALSGLLEETVSAMGGPLAYAALPSGFDLVWRVPGDSIQRGAVVDAARTRLAQIPRHSNEVLWLAYLLGEFGATEEGLQAMRSMVSARSPFVPMLNYGLVARLFRRNPDYLAILDEVGLPHPRDSEGE